MNIVQATVSCDLSELAFSHALAALRCMPEEATVFCSNDMTITAEALRKMHGCTVVLVPKELMIGSYAWAVKCDHGIYWSPGVE